jgi:hypothetical protein
VLREKLNAQKGLPRASYKELLEAGGALPPPALPQARRPATVLASPSGAWPG